MNLSEVITEIQSLGIRVPKEISGRKGGAGPAEGRAFIISGIAVNAPISNSYITKSCYSLSPKNNGGLILCKNGHEISSIEVVPDPQFYSHYTKDGTGYHKIALLHGFDCLATTVFQKCIHWRSSNRCAFCGTEISLSNNATVLKKTPEMLVEVTQKAIQSDKITHAVLTSGTGDPPGSEILYLAKCVRAIKSVTDLPIHVQFAPPDDLSLLDVLKDAGTDTVGIHIESFDMNTLKRLAPAKAAIGIQQYELAWKKAVVLFGPNQVSSFLIAGIGESPESIVWGSEILADLGVYPFVVPLRPISGSRLENSIPPTANTMKQIYSAVASILKKKGLTSESCKAGCVRCGACSALRTYEKPVANLICHSTRNEKEISEAFTIRNEVFVKEQGLFEHTDIDEKDPLSMHLVAKSHNHIIGTVRVFPESENGRWVGGRLAVSREHRIYRVGAMLVKEAMKRVKKRGCTVFTAHIQVQNVPFFKKLGWKPVGDLEHFHDRPHQLMEADLDRVPDD